MSKGRHIGTLSCVFLLNILIPSIIVTIASLYWFLSFSPQYTTAEVSKFRSPLQRLWDSPSRRNFERWLGSRSDTWNRRVPYWLPIWFINKPSGSIGRLPSISEMDEDAHRALPLLENLKEHKFFRIFKINLNKECPFWARSEMCGAGNSCQICECNDEHIPQPWKRKPTRNFVDRNHYVDKSIMQPWGAELKTDDSDDSDDGNDSDVVGLSEFKRTTEFGIGVLESKVTVSDERSPRAQYVDLTLNRAGFTAYRGRNIWGLIYKENCLTSNPLKYSSISVLSDVKNECTEEEAFYKIISGMQTVIMVLSAEYHTLRKPMKEHMREMEDLKKKGKIVSAETYRSQYASDMKLFKERVAVGKDWMENLYFTFGILLKTFCHVGPVLRTCDCDTGNPYDDNFAREKLYSLLNEDFNVCKEKYKDEKLFKQKQSIALKQFRNISRIMDCLDCEKCRLHGKVKILALQLALRASGSDAKIWQIERNELIALINALEYFADAIVTLERFEFRLRRQQLRWLTLFVCITTSIVFTIKQIRSLITCRNLEQKRCKET